jgi:hypothetical protein
MSVPVPVPTLPNLAPLALRPHARTIGAIAVKHAPKLIRGGLWLAGALAPLAFVFACDGHTAPPQGPTTPTSVRPQASAPPSAPSASASASTSASTTAIATPPAPPPACVVKSATWPEGGVAPKIGADLALLGAPARVPAGATLAIEVVRTGHVVTLVGPAAFRACTPEEPDTLVVALGAVSVAPAAGTKPDAKIPELAVATPSTVAFAGALPFAMTVGANTVADVPVKGGEVHFGTSENGEKKILGKYTFHRDESTGLVLSRCVVQAASDTASDRLQRQLAADAGPPLPSTSVSVLAVEGQKHHRLAQTDCGVAQARALLCDVAAADGLKEGSDGCQGSYASAHAEIVKARRPVDLPPGTPFPAAAAK